MTVPDTLASASASRCSLDDAIPGVVPECPVCRGIFDGVGSPDLYCRGCGALLDADRCIAHDDDGQGGLVHVTLCHACNQYLTR